MSKITDIVEDLRNIENLSGSAQEVLVSGTNEDWFPYNEIKTYEEFNLNKKNRRR